MHPEPVADFELDAYVDGELDPARRLAVEEYAAATPSAAMQLMGDFAQRSALRLAQPRLGQRTDLLADAARLNRRLRGARHSFSTLIAGRKWMGAAGAAAALCAGALFLPSGPVAQAKPPLFVEDAVDAFRTGLLRANMPSQIETTRFDSRDVQRFTHIRVPTLPSDWKITDVQVFPSEEGPALQIMIRTPARKTVSIFAVRSGARAPLSPTTIRSGGASVAYWRHGEIAYALTGIDAPAALDLAAEDLADNGLE